VKGGGDHTCLAYSLHKALVRIKAHITARCWWLTPVILATWEAEVRRIEVQSQPEQIVLFFFFFDLSK
jgi:hypothetical protein